ncbi:MAG: hypothetical protein K2X81_05715 [Candidatus Obscuribacterales bacterium]|nr:hypothetical protein [Candidatus Obscuribacterales bacterium]
MKFKNTSDFNQALERQLRDGAEGNRDLIFDRTQRVAYERLFARIEKVAFLTGGQAVDKHLAASLFSGVSTIDADSVIFSEIVKEMKFDKITDPGRQHKSVLGFAREVVGTDLGDNFSYRIVESESKYFSDAEEKGLGHRFYVECDVCDTYLTKLIYDVGLENERYRIPTQTLPGRNLLRFAEIKNPAIQVTCPEYLIAGKICVFTKNHAEPKFERLNDIAHAARLIQAGGLDEDRLIEGLAVLATFRNHIPHLLREPMPEPPKHWHEGFAEVAGFCNLNLDLKEAHQLVRQTVEPLFTRAYTLSLDLSQDRQPMLDFDRSSRSEGGCGER